MSVFVRTEVTYKVADETVDEKMPCGHLLEHGHDPSPNVTNENDHCLCGTESDNLETPALDGVKSDMGNTGDTPLSDNKAVTRDFAHFAHADINATLGCLGEKDENGKRLNTHHTFRIVENNPSLYTLM